MRMFAWMTKATIWGGGGSGWCWSGVEVRGDVSVGQGMVWGIFLCVVW